MPARNSIGNALILCWLACMTLVVGSAGCDRSDTKELDLSRVGPETQPVKPSDAKKVYYFGFDARQGPQEDARQLLPLMNYLQRTTGYKFELRFTPKNSSTEEMLGQAQLDFAAIGAVSYIKARKNYRVVSVVRGVNSHNQSSYQSMLVVRPDSKIKTVAGIKGKIMAFGNRNSTQGHLIPRIILLRNKIALRDLKQYFYTGSHRNCADAVLSRRADVCGMQDVLAREMAAKGLLRILYESGNYPASLIAANRDIDPDVLEKVKLALLDFKPQGRDKRDLYHWERTEMPNGFIAAHDAEYEKLQKWMQKLGMLN